MNILIAGASGFVGKLVVARLSKKHNITVLGRELAKLEMIFSSDINKVTWDALDTLDAKKFDIIFNFSGFNIADKRWNKTIKQVIVDSRVHSNQCLTKWLIAYGAKPRFFSASAVGIYGAYEDDGRVYDEMSSLISSQIDFLQDVGRRWEEALQPAIDANIPVTIMRFGVVLKRGDGMLNKLELPFRLGLGNILGSGRQVLSWIYYEDLLAAIDFLMANPQAVGVFNLTSPYPVSQKEFAQTLASVLKRPLFIRLPATVVKALFGEMGEILLVRGQRVLPERLLQLGFCFEYARIDSALKHALLDAF